MARLEHRRGVGPEGSSDGANWGKLRCLSRCTVVVSLVAESWEDRMTMLSSLDIRLGE